MLNFVVQSPAGKLPRALIDHRTGLAKNNLQAICRRSAPRDALLCFIHPAGRRPGEGLYVRYRVGASGRATFTWYPYQRGSAR